MKTNQYTGFEVAVVGISLRTSGATDWREFWQNLVLSKESLCFLTEKELIDAGMDKSFIKDKNYVNCTTNLINKDCFDSKFFGYSIDEAKMMFPGHRFFHECVWEALEDAGYIPENMKESVGIYAGGGDDLLWKSFVSLSSESQKVNSVYLDKITNKDYLTTLVSYKLGLKGPSIAINTACSTSLVAIHTACKALIFGETKIALAGATSLISSSQKGYIYEEGSIISKDGHCKAFDKDATGTVNGEGSGVVVLKRLKDALEDKDNIYAIIKGSAINNDGNKKVGFTAPSIEGQVACIKMAQKFSKVEPETISYIETHGTGTTLGDSIEIKALNIAFNNNKDFSCPIGSVKTNIGHLDTASGVAGFIKTVLSIKNKKIPATLHFNEPSSNINFQDGPFFVNDNLSEWEAKNENPLRAAVSSFGIGGTNAHVILEEAPIIDRDSSEKDYKLLVLSAKTETSLSNYFNKFSKFLENIENLNLSDMCYTYQTGRQNFENRIALSFNNKNELQQKLKEIIIRGEPFAKVKNIQSSVVFMFPGQGSQYINMGKDLYQSNPIFKEYMDNGFELLYRLTNKEFKKIVYPEHSNINYNINDTSFAQPIIFLIEYSLTKLLMDYGIMPNYMMGHSIGEYTAACISGLFTFEQALKLVVKRGELMFGLPKGSMISVPIDELQAQNYLNDEISLAAINGPNQVVFSGNDNAIEILISRLIGNEIPYIKLHTSHAFHSGMQDSILEEFKNEFRTVEFNKMQVPFISNITGDFIKNEEAISSEYWAKQLRSTVEFSKGVNNLLLNDNLIFIEVGAGSSLSSLIKQHKTEKNIKTVDILRSVKIVEKDEKYFLENLGLLWTYGVNIKWKELYKNEERYRISLPTYAFDNLKYKAEIDHNKLFNEVKHIALNDLENSFYFPSWKRSILSLHDNLDGKNFLVFSDDSDCSKEIVKGIKNASNNVIEVLIGTSYFKHSSSRFSIDPLNIENYNQLFNDIESEYFIISKVIYSWGLNIDSSKVKLIEDNLEFNIIYFCPSRIIKVWENGEDKNIYILTNLLHSVLGNEKINYANSLLLGLVKVMPLENQILGANIDIDLDNCNEKMIQDIVLEILNNDMLTNRIISFRLGQRWVQEFQKSVQDLSKKATSTIKKQGTYLITGGLGKLGFSISKYLINEYQANIILLGRKDLNKISDSEDISARRYNELIKLNKNIRYLSVDVSNSLDFNRVVLENENLFNDINGIIHLARGDDNDLDFIENLNLDKSIKMLSPKVNGIENLYSMCKNIDMDFIWMTSSLSATFGNMGLSAYISSNIYLEYFVFSKLENFKCIEIPRINFEENYTNSMQYVLSTSEVIEVFERSLNIKNSNVIYISKEDINSTLKTNLSKIEVEYNQTKEKIERPALQTKYLSPQTDLERRLKLIFEDFLEMDDIGIRDDFFELGGDSLKAMVFLKKINKEFNIEISIRDFFLNKNIKGIANLIDEKNWLNTNIDLKNEIII